MLKKEKEKEWNVSLVGSTWYLINHLCCVILFKLHCSSILTIAHFSFYNSIYPTNEVHHHSRDACSLPGSCGRKRNTCICACACGRTCAMELVFPNFADWWCSTRPSSTQQVGQFQGYFDHYRHFWGYS